MVQTQAGWYSPRSSLVEREILCFYSGDSNSEPSILAYILCAMKSLTLPSVCLKVTAVTQKFNFFVGFPPSVQDVFAI